MIPALVALVACRSTTAGVGPKDVRTCDPLDQHAISIRTRIEDRAIEDHWLPLVLEAELARFPGLVPRLEPLPPLPGLGELPSEWEVTVHFEEPAAAALICREEVCVSRVTELDPVAPERAAAHLAALIASELGHTDADVNASLHAPQDRYTRLVAGRAGQTERSSREDRRDPVQHALLLQPLLRPVQWLALRTRGDLDDRLPALQRLARGENATALDLAALADAYERTDQPYNAHASWARLVSDYPHDRRWRLPAAHNAMAVGDLDLVDEALAGLPSSPAVAELKVELAERRRLDGADERLLRQWARVDPDDPDPVERLIDRRLAEGDLQDVLDLSDELQERGAVDEAEELRFAVEANLDRATPPLDELQRARSEHRARAEQAKGYVADLAEAQNLLMMARHERRLTPCEGEGAKRLAQTRDLGRATREVVRQALQAARYLRGVLEAPVVEPVLDPDRQQSIEVELAQSMTLPEAYRAAVTVQQEQLEPWGERCR